MSTSSKKLTLKSCDDVIFVVDKEVAFQSETIKEVSQTSTDGNYFRAPNVNGSVLAKVIDYCKKHGEAHSTAAATSDVIKELRVFDEELVKLDLNGLLDLAWAADYLRIPGLMDIVCKAISDHLEEKEPEEIREIFDIQNDFTEEEVSEIKKQYKWAFESK